MRLFTISTLSSACSMHSILIDVGEITRERQGYDKILGLSFLSDRISKEKTKTSIVGSRCDPFRSRLSASTTRPRPPRCLARSSLPRSSLRSTFRRQPGRIARSLVALPTFAFGSTGSVPHSSAASSNGLGKSIGWRADCRSCQASAPLSICSRRACLIP